MRLLHAYKKIRKNFFILIREFKLTEDVVKKLQQLQGKSKLKFQKKDK